MKAVALLVGIVLLALGVAGFIPALNEGGMLFGVVPANPVICGLFVITGIAGIVLGTSNRRTLVPSDRPHVQDLRPWV
jgi:hypothetical protein